MTPHQLPRAAITPTTWIKSRARAIERFYAGTTRRTALAEARLDWALLMGQQRLSLIQGASS